MGVHTEEGNEKDEKEEEEEREEDFNSISFTVHSLLFLIFSVLAHFSVKEFDCWCVRVTIAPWVHESVCVFSVGALICQNPERKRRKFMYVSSTVRDLDMVTTRDF